MNFKRHLDLEGKHAFLSPSTYHWINYDDTKLAARFVSSQEARRGTALHEFAKNAIELGIRLPDTDSTLHRYVNDAIDLEMNVEQALYYSPNCFGHADALSFRNNLLRISDLKTGSTSSSMHQLEVYAALFCLEYGYSPFDIEIELRIYQSNDVRALNPEPEAILRIMDKIISFDRLLTTLRGD